MHIINSFMHVRFFSSLPCTFGHGNVHLMLRKRVNSNERAGSETIWSKHWFEKRTSRYQWPIVVPLSYLIETLNYKLMYAKYQFLPKNHPDINIGIGIGINNLRMYVWLIELFGFMWLHLNSKTQIDKTHTIILIHAHAHAHTVEKYDPWGMNSVLFNSLNCLLLIRLLFCTLLLMLLLLLVFFVLLSDDDWHRLTPWYA